MALQGHRAEVCKMFLPESKLFDPAFSGGQPSIEKIA